MLPARLHAELCDSTGPVGRGGRNQAVRIPRAWEFDADEALLRREDGVLTLVLVPRAGLLP